MLSYAICANTLPDSGIENINTAGASRWRFRAVEVLVIGSIIRALSSAHSNTGGVEGQRGCIGQKYNGGECLG